MVKGVTGALLAVSEVQWQILIAGVPAKLERCLITASAKMPHSSNHGNRLSKNG